jgi:hypothetical protein
MTDSREILKFVLETLRENDYHRVTKKEMSKIVPGKNVIGAYIPYKHKIYVRKDLMGNLFENTLLHELSHVYYNNTGNVDVDEDIVQALADKWHKIIYGLEERL